MRKIYCLPGTMCDQRLWLACKTFIDADIELVHLAIPALDSVDEMITAIHQQIHDNHINLAGFSLGGYLACALTLKYPEKINRLCIISNMPCALPKKELIERTRTMNWLKTHGYTGVPEKRITNLLHKSQHNNSAIKDCIKAMDKTLGGKTLINQLSATTQRIDLLPALAKSNIACHFIFGNEDPLLNHNKLLSHISESENFSHTSIENTGHMLPLEQPKKLAQEMSSWFSA